MPDATSTERTDGIAEKRKRGGRKATKGIMSEKAHAAGTERSRIPLAGKSSCHSSLMSHPGNKHSGLQTQQE